MQKPLLIWVAGYCAWVIKECQKLKTFQIHTTTLILNFVQTGWMFLAATCRFCIGTASGFFRECRNSLVFPVILTNSTQTIPYFSLTDKDIFLPRMLKKTSTNEPISIYSLMASPTNLVSSDDVFRKIGLSWINNTPEEITESVKQMMHAFKPNGFKHENISENQQGFNTKISNYAVLSCPLTSEFLDEFLNTFSKILLVEQTILAGELMMIDEEHVPYLDFIRRIMYRQYSIRV